MPNEPSGAKAATEVIDVHAHVVLEGVLGTAGVAGPVLEDGPAPRFRAGDHVLEGVRYRGSPFMDVELRLDRMDAAGIDRQVLSPNPLTFFHHLDASTAIAFARHHNDELAALVAGQDRLDGFAQLPLQAPDDAAEELRRAVDELGMRGAYIGTRTTRELDDPAFDALWSAAVELDVPIMLHPAPDAVDAPTRDPRLGRWDLDLLIGFAYDETLAVATLVYGGVLCRFPQLDVCISHGGGTAPYLYGRLAAAARQRPWAPPWLREPGAFQQQLRRLWFDCHIHDPRALDLLATMAGTDRLVFGTNFAGWDQGEHETVAAVAGTVHANTARLLERG